MDGSEESKEGNMVRIFISNDIVIANFIYRTGGGALDNKYRPSFWMQIDVGLRKEGRKTGEKKKFLNKSGNVYCAKDFHNLFWVNVPTFLAVKISPFHVN